MIYGRGSDHNFYIREDCALEFWKLFTIPIDDENGEDILIDGNNKDCVCLINDVLGIFVRNDFNPLAEFIDKG